MRRAIKDITQSAVLLEAEISDLGQGVAQGCSMSPMWVRAQWHTGYDSDTSILLLPICIIQCISCS